MGEVDALLPGFELSVSSVDVEAPYVHRLAPAPLTFDGHDDLLRDLELGLRRIAGNSCLDLRHRLGQRLPFVRLQPDAFGGRPQLVAPPVHVESPDVHSDHAGEAADGPSDLVRDLDGYFFAGGRLAGIDLGLLRGRRCRPGLRRGPLRTLGGGRGRLAGASSTTRAGLILHGDAVALQVRQQLLAPAAGEDPTAEALVPLAPFFL
mmetsp:Transcript_102655/g.319902  ORF Transcript_102655/g.319902 Transcript_102655/m.319902 type:complete len:206 (-) Transcript_102655:153-770(-)